MYVCMYVCMYVYEKLFEREEYNFRHNEYFLCYLLLCLLGIVKHGLLLHG